MTDFNLIELACGKRADLASRVLLAGRLDLGTQAGRPRRKRMNLISLIKILFATAILALLVLAGVNNHEQVGFSLPPFMTQAVQQPAALMYFGFFAVGLLTGIIVGMGNGKKLEKGKKPA